MNFLLQLLNITTVFTTKSWQLSELNAIVRAAQNKSEILTVTLFGQPLEIEPFIRVMEEYNVPKIVITRNYGGINFNYKTDLNKEMFFIAVASLERKELWNHLNNAFMGIQGHVRGIFLTTRPKRKNSSLNLRQHFEWCWKKGFTNDLVLVDNENIYQQQFEIYNYNHFLPRKVINMTNLKELDLYPDKFRNLYKFKIRTAAQFDPPRVFEKLNCNVKYKNRLLGYVALLFQAFLKEYNADVDLIYFAKNKSYNFMEIIQRIENDEIDLGINPYVPYKNVHLSYPLRMLKKCIVVPFPKELSKYKFFIMPFQAKAWLSYSAIWFSLSTAKVFGWFLKYKESWSKKSTDVSYIFLEFWRLMMYLPCYTSLCYKNFKWFNAVCFILVAIISFIFSNLYLASLTSFFSGLTFKPLINTIDDLIQRRITVDVVDYEISAIKNNRNLPKDFVKLLRARNASDLLNDILQLQPNHSYMALEDQIQFVFNQQIHLLKPISQMVQECLTTMPLGFLIPAHSQFENPLNHFILRSSSAGLIDKWILESIQDGYCSGVLNMRKPKLAIARPLTLKHFQFGWYVLAGGYAVGVLVFLLENLQRIFKRFKIFIVYY